MQPPSSIRTYFSEKPSMVSVRSCNKDSNEETEEVKRLFQTLGHLSISDAAFALQSFMGSSHCGDQAEKWLEQFSRYVTFKKLNEEDQLQLFQLLMKDQAADWLTSLPLLRKDDIHVLKDEFMKRHQMTRVEKWRQTADIWKRRQGPTEPVDDYIAAMQAAARRVKMAQSSLADAIIQGLRPEIRLHVLHAGSETLEQILEAARISEAAHSANLGQTTSTDKLAVKVEQLLDRLTAQTTTPDPILQPKKVTFTQSAVTESSSRRPLRERSASPSSRAQSPNDGRRCDYDPRQSSSRSSAWPTNFARQPPRVQMDGGRFDRRETDNRRFTSPAPQQSTSWRPSTRFTPNDAPTATRNFGPRLGRPAPPQTTYFNPTYQRVTGNCYFCGNTHPQGRQFCPAANIQCFNCSKMGHLAKMCRSRSTASGYSPYSQH
jgi:hypothetical protein